MRIIGIALLCMTLSFPAVAEEEKMSPENIAKMKAQMKQGIKPQGMPDAKQIDPKAIEAMQGMNKCFETKIGKDGMKRMSQEGSKMEAKVKALCREKKQSEAEQVQKEYALRMNASAEFKAMQACAEQHKGMLKSPMFTGVRKQLESGAPSKKSICE